MYLFKLVQLQPTAATVTQQSVAESKQRTNTYLASEKTISIIAEQFIFPYLLTQSLTYTAICVVLLSNLLHVLLILFRSNGAPVSEYIIITYYLKDSVLSTFSQLEVNYRHLCTYIVYVIIFYISVCTAFR